MKQSLPQKADLSVYFDLLLLAISYALAVLFAVFFMWFISHNKLILFCIFFVMVLNFFSIFVLQWRIKNKMERLFIP